MAVDSRGFLMYYYDSAVVSAVIIIILCEVKWQLH
jgi:hypothetical protein